MKRLLTICAVAVMFAFCSSVQAETTVNVSLEPSAGTVVSPGQTFELELWFQSDPTGAVVHHLNDLGLHWDPACVSFDGPASTADGAYAWSTAMCYAPGVMCIPMYWDAVAANATYTDGDAELMLAPQFAGMHSMSLPTTDQHQLTLTFTALALTDSTSIWLTTSDGVWAENPDAAHVMDCTGDLTGATVSIVLPKVNVSLEPSTGTVGVGQTFDLELWLKSDTPDVVMHYAHLLLDWDPACVSFSGSASTANGDYDWTTAMSGPIPSMNLPMYPHEGTAGENETYTDGDALIMLYPGFDWLHGMSKPQTDLHAVTLTFTALALSDSTSITVAPDLPTGIAAEWYSWEYNEWTGEWYWHTYVSECSGTMTGATVSIVPSYACSGFEPPMDKGPVKVKNNKRVLPLKAQLLDGCGNPVTDADITAPPVIQIMFDSGEELAVEIIDDALFAGEGTEGNQFVFTEEGKWQFNLKIKNYSSLGTYTITMVSGDDTEYVIAPTCEAQFVIK